MKTLCSLVLAVLCLSGAAYSEDALNVSVFCYSMKTKDAEPFLKLQEPTMKTIDAQAKARRAAFLGGVTAISPFTKPVTVRYKDVNLESELSQGEGGALSVNAKVKVRNAKLDAKATVAGLEGAASQTYLGSTFTDSTKSEMMLVFLSVTKPGHIGGPGE